MMGQFLGMGKVAKEVNLHDERIVDLGPERALSAFDAALGVLVVAGVKGRLPWILPAAPVLQ